jgi:hypothetical protein
MNIYQILETLKRVEETAMNDLDVMFNDWINSEDCPYNDMAGDDRAVMGCAYRYLAGKVDPSKIEDYAIALTHAFHGGIDESTDDDDYESDEGDYADTPGVHAQVNRAGFNALTPQSYADKIDFIDRQLADPRQQQNWPEFKQRRLDLMTAAQRAGIVKEGSKFKFANPKQKTGDQVRGTEKAVSKKGQHPFAGRLVGAMEGAEIADEAKATKTRLDPKCWSGKKIGNPKTKVKGGVRVNNCVPVEEEWEDFVNEYGMTTGGTVTGASQTNPADQAKQVADTQADMQKLKAAGVPFPGGSQAVQSLMKEPGKDPASALDKQISAGLGQEVQDIVTKGDPSDVNQLATLIRKVNQRSGA